MIKKLLSRTKRKAGDGGKKPRTKKTRVFNYAAFALAAILTGVMVAAVLTSDTDTAKAADTYTLKYDANNDNATGSMSNSTGTFGSWLTLRSCGYTVKGYHLDYWTLKAVKNGTTYWWYYSSDTGQNRWFTGATGTYTSKTELSDGTRIKLFKKPYSDSVVSWSSGQTFTAVAHWAANTYTIKYSSNGGSGSMSDTSATYGKSVTLRANSFSRTGYTFNGWNTKKDGSGDSYKNKASVKNLTATNGGSVTLYAQWKANTYTLTLKYYNVSTKAWTTYKTYTMTYNSTSHNSVSTKSQTGYTFGGWYTGKSATLPTYGSNTNGNGTQVYGSSGGYKSAATSYWSSGKWIKTSNVTLYAKYTGVGYTIKYYANNGSGSMSDTSATYGSNVTLSTNSFTRTGYKFLGWSTSSTATTATYTDGQTISGGIKNTNSQSGGTVSLYAVWAAESYSLSFNGNGGTVPTTSGTTTLGTAKVTYASTNISYASKTNYTNVSAYTPSRTGYKFNGWYTAASGGTQVFTSTGAKKTGTSYWDSNSKWAYDAGSDGATIQLYAQWTAYTYTVYLNPYGGNWGSTKESKSYTMTYASGNYNSSYRASNAIAMPTREGYTFAGWYTGTRGTGTMVYKPVSSSSGMRALYNSSATAYWDSSGNWALASNGGSITLYAYWVKDDASWDMSSIIEDSNMFLSASLLVGANGTKYSQYHVDSKYAVIDASTQKGYMTGK